MRSLIVCKKEKLLQALELMLDHCNCQCGGFDGKGVVSQPCDICDKVRAIIEKEKKGDNSNETCD